jgi:hypothetical protein
MKDTFMHCKMTQQQMIDWLEQNRPQQWVIRNSTKHNPWQLIGAYLEVTIDCAYEYAPLLHAKDDLFQVAVDRITVIDIVAERRPMTWAEIQEWLKPHLCGWVIREGDDGQWHLPNQCIYHKDRPYYAAELVYNHSDNFAVDKETIIELSVEV